jgi:hypothetical protein
MGKKSRKSKTPRPYDEKTLADVAAGKSVAITREQALVGLIETAIRLLVDGKDMGSIHVLTFAAWKVLLDLGKKDGKGPIIHTNRRAEGWLFDGYDFFRHASPKFREVTINVPVLLNEIILFDTVVSFYKQFSTRTPLMRTFLFWFMIDYRDYVKPFKDVLNQPFPTGISVEQIAELSRVDFFKLFLPVVGELAHPGIPPD